MYTYTHIYPNISGRGFGSSKGRKASKGLFCVKAPKRALPIAIQVQLCAPSVALGSSKSHSERKLEPLGSHLGVPSRTPSATRRLLGATWPSKTHFKCNLAPLR